MSPSTKRITSISLVLFLLAAAAFAFVFVQIQYQGEELSTQIAVLDEQRAQEESYFQLRRIAETSQVSRTQLESYFFSNESESIDFLNMIEELAPTTGVALNTTSLSLVDDEADSRQWIEVGFSFDGSLSKVQNFLTILEELPYVSKVVSVNMAAVTQAKWQAEVTMRVRVLNYDE